MYDDLGDCELVSPLQAHGVCQCIRSFEIEEQGELSFLDCLVHRINDRFPVSVYKKPTHTNKYLDFRSHHPIHVKCGVVNCLYNRARCITTDALWLEREETRIKDVFVVNNFPRQFIESSLQVKKRNNNEETQDRDKDHLLCIPYVNGVSEDIRRICRQYNLQQVIFKSGRTLRSILTGWRMLSPQALAPLNVVYKILCSCEKVYIGETIHRLETRLKEHRTACKKGETDKSAIAEHAWKEHHPILWEETKVIDQAKKQKQLLIKEALNIHCVSEEERLNRDTGLEIPDCWKRIIKKQ